MRDQNDSSVARDIFQAATFLRRANHIIISAYSCRYSTGQIVLMHSAVRLSLSLPIYLYKFALSAYIHDVYPTTYTRLPSCRAVLSAAYTARRHDTVIYHRHASCGFSALPNEFHNRIKFSARARRAGPKRGGSQLRE